MKFIDYKCLESLLTEGAKMIATEEVASGITNFASKVPIYFKSSNAKIKSIILPGNLIYFDELMNICVKNNLTADDFAKFISTYGKSINSTDEYFLNRGLTKLKDLIYVGTHQNVGLDIFYSKNKKAFVTISEDESINNITSDDFVSWKDVIQSYKSNKDIIWNSATESTNTSIKLTNSDINDFILYKVPSSVNELLKEGLKVEGTYKPFAITAFGEILAYEDHYICKISFEENEMHIIGTKEFESDLKDPGFLKDYFNMEDYIYARKTLGKLKPGECYGYQPLRSIGGTKSNLAKVKFAEYNDFCIQMNGPIT